MQLKNTQTAYGAVTKTFHWVVAALVLFMLGLGLYMNSLPVGVDKLRYITLHKSLGATILVLVACRICWHVYNHRPDEVETLAWWEKLGAGAAHYSLYALLLAMPLTGWMMSSAFGRSVSVFGLFTLPDLVAKDPDRAETYVTYHNALAFTLMGVAGLHIAAALWHHFIRRDIVLKRMLPALLAFLLIGAPAQAATQSWNLLHDKSSITFAPKQMGTAFKGTFDTFSAVIDFSAGDLAHSKAVIVIQIGSAHTGAADRDDALKGKEWFDVAQFPEAKFESKSFHKTDNGYTADGTLTVHGISQPVTLPFTLAFSDDKPGLQTATMEGHVTLDRSKFQLGAGQWADASIIANEVPVDIHVVALTRKP